jgi:STE24 endopeptidase
MKKHVLLAALALFLLCTALAARAQEKVDLSQSQMPSVITVPPEALPSSHFDIDAATNAYLAQIPASAHARSDSYFEGATGSSSGIF